MSYLKKKRIPVLPQLFHIKEKEGILPNSLHDRYSTKKEKQSIVTNIDFKKNPKQNISQPNLAVCKSDNTS